MGRSSHWASSTITTTGARPADSLSKCRAASAIKNKSGAATSEMPKAALIASRCSGGSSSTRDRIGRSSCCKPANGRSVSDCTPAVLSTCMPRSIAMPHAAASSADFPTPASPRTTRDAPHSLTPSNRQVITSSSRARPIKHGACPLRIISSGLAKPVRQHTSRIKCPAAEPRSTPGDTPAPFLYVISHVGWGGPRPRNPAGGGVACGSAILHNS